MGWRLRFWLSVGSASWLLSVPAFQAPWPAPGLHSQLRLTGSKCLRSRANHPSDGTALWATLPTATAGTSGLSLGDFALGLLFLAFCINYLPKIPGLSADAGQSVRVGSFRYLVNRGSIPFSDAIHSLAVDHPNYDEDSVFTYFDLYGGVELPDVGKYARLIQVISRDTTDVYDHKRGMELRLRESGCEGVFAKTFFSAKEALEATSGESSALFFAKLPDQTGGESIKVLRREDLEQEHFAEDYVFQRAVQDVEVIDDRKFVIRYYFLVHGQQVYLCHRGVLIVHGLPYSPDSVDFGVQVRHDWMSEDKLGAYLLLLHTSSEGPRWRAAIAQQLRALRPALQPLLEASSKDRYVLVGGDALIESTGHAKLIEFNMYPNLFSGNDMVDKQVYVPMLKDVMAKILLADESDELEPVLI